MAPSREFMVRQAILNAMQAEMPTTLKLNGPVNVGNYILALPARLDIGGPVPLAWVKFIQREFRILAARYGA